MHFHVMPTICRYENENKATTQQININSLFLKNIKAEIDIHKYLAFRFWFVSMAATCLGSVCKDIY